MTERIALYVEQAGTAAQPARVFQMTSCFTRRDPAYIFEARQSSISNAKRQDAIPSDRFIKPLYLRGVNHDRLMDGVEPTCPTPSNDPIDTNCHHESSHMCKPVTRPLRAVFPQRLTGELRCGKALTLPKPVLQNFM